VVASQLVTGLQVGSGKGVFSSSSNRHGKRGSNNSGTNSGGQGVQFAQLSHVQSPSIIIEVVSETALCGSGKPRLFA
jgi:hypothetical protein